jgi:hypothetical protein
MKNNNPMKKVTKVMAAVCIMAGFATTSYGQATATASSTATMVAPIGITKVVDLNFGVVAASGTAGTLILGTSDDRTASGGVSLPAGGATDVKSAEFAVTGEGTSGFSISVPSAPITLTGSVSGTMTVSDFVSDLGAASTLVSGEKTIKIGATLNVDAAQPAGVYTNASGLFVTVNYN